MKKLVLLLCIFISACTTKYAETNITAFVKEQLGDTSQNIESVEIIKTDSMLTDGILNEERLRSQSDSLVSGQISDDKFREIVDDAYAAYHDLYTCWRYGDKNDSLASLKKYVGMWKKTITVRVTYKSSATEDIRIVMEGEKPVMTEDQFKSRMQRESIIAALCGTLNWDW